MIDDPLDTMTCLKIINEFEVVQSDATSYRLEANPARVGKPNLSD